MKRAMLWCAGGLMLGILSARQLSAAMLLGLFILFLIPVTVFVFFRFERTKLTWYVPLLCVLIGFTYMNVYTQWAEARTEPFDGEKLTVCGRITDVIPKEHHTAIRLRTQRIGARDIRLSMELRVYDEAPKLSVGQSIRATAKLSRPTGLRNDGLFYYPDYLKARRVILTGSANAEELTITDSVPRGWRVLPDRVRSYIKVTATKLLSAENSGILIGIMLGDRSGISDEMKEVFRHCGISHITAVSGLHVSLILSFMMLIFYFWGNKRSAFRVVYILGILAVVVITGATPSVVRAGVMIILFEVGWIVRRESDGLNSLAIAAMLLLLWNPYTVYDTGFRLSFAATFAILLFATPIANLCGLQKVHWRWLRFLIGAFSVTIAAQIGTIPLSVASFHELPVLSVLANVIVAPLLPLILGSGILFHACYAIAAPPGILIAFLCNGFLDLLRMLAKLIASLPFAVIPCPTFPDAMLVAYISLFVGVSCLVWKSTKRVAVIAFVLSAFSLIAFFCGTWIRRNDIDVSFVNVGQGDCALITSREQAIWIDGGGNRFSDIGESVLSDYLSYRGIMKPAAAIITHYDLDHYDGIVSLMKQGKIRQIFVPKYAEASEAKTYVMDCALQTGTLVTPISAGDTLTLGDGLKLFCLSPHISAEARADNDQGIVCRVEANGRSFFFGGDISGDTEAELVRAGVLQPADVLKADHHGSNGSNQTEFLNCILPEYVVISYGNNSYGLPGEDAMTRLTGTRARILTTKENGTVTFHVAQSGSIRLHTTE